MSNPLRPWTPEEQERHRRDLLDALDDIAWDPDWPALAAQLIPDPDPEERLVQGTWLVPVSQKEWIRRQAGDQKVSEGMVLRRVLADHLATLNPG